MGKNLLDDNSMMLAKELNVSENFVKLLLNRGFCADELCDFLHPSLDKLVSPFAVDGMADAAERLHRAFEKKEKITIFGDYDCDGICAVSILALAFSGITDVDYFIPERGKDGYGLTVDAVKKVLEINKPDLIVTVDCGITAAAEAEYIKRRGADVIITDHHEPQGNVPDCIVVDPKIKRNGFYELCGAGVALKLVEAVFGRAEAEKYLDIAAIATVADVVPLVNENRIIAYFGLKNIREHPRKGLKILLDSEKVSSGEIMFRLAPKLNAAGRLNSAMKVVDLFLTDDYFTLKTLSDELARDNERRQEICERVVTEAKDMLKRVDFNETRIIILERCDWEPGVLGVAAARITEEFKCPAILFAGNGELKGSARSVSGVNIFELLSEFSGYFTAFGGHSQAAGVSMRVENIDKFRTDINSRIKEIYGIGAFAENEKNDGELNTDDGLLSFAKELDLLEPTGFGNPKPRFKIVGNGLKFEKIGFSQHVKCRLPKLDVVGFGKFGHLASVGNGKSEFEVTLGVNEFQNVLTAQAVLKSADVREANLSNDDCRGLCLGHLRFEGETEIESIELAEIEKLLAKRFGTLFVCFNQNEYDILTSAVPQTRNLPVFVSAQRYLNPENAVVIAPGETFDFRFYKTVIISGKPLTSGYLKHLADESTFVKCFGDCEPERLAVPAEAFRNVYIIMRKFSAENRRFQTLKQLFFAAASETGLTSVQFSAVYHTLADLGLISVSVRGIISVSNVKTDLNSSAAYRNLEKV